MLAHLLYSAARGKALSSSRWYNADLCVWAFRCAARRSYSEAQLGAQRTSPLGIQMLSPSLHQQIFNSSPVWCDEKVNRSREHLQRHGVMKKGLGAVMADVDFRLPQMVGGDLDEHFRRIALEQVKPYVDLAQYLLDSTPPDMPKVWEFKPGWTKYEGGQAMSIPYPEEDVTVLDVEVCVQESHRPVLATAVSPICWYSWVSERLTSSDEDYFSVHSASKHSSTLEELIPLETLKGEVEPHNGEWRRRLVVGHCVSYDRARIKEQYFLKGPKTCFLDTMSLHTCVAGLTAHQKLKWLQKKESSHISKSSWMKVGAPNALEHVYKHHCNAGGLDKKVRDVFVKGTVDDIRKDFQLLMQYCAEDSLAAYKVFCKVYPEFLERCPHPVTLAGMLEMGSVYLPVNKRWDTFLEDTADAYDGLQHEMKTKLMRLADEACGSFHQERYKDNPWLTNLDWSVKKYRGKRSKPKDMKLLLNDIHNLWDGCHIQPAHPTGSRRSAEILKEEVVGDSHEFLILPVTQDGNIAVERRRQPVHMPGLPEWYCKLCLPLDDPVYQPGPVLLSAQTQVTPYLLHMTWEGHPLYKHPQQGWGYLVPVGRTVDTLSTADKDMEQFFLNVEDVAQTIADLDPEHLLLDKDSDIDHPVHPASKKADDRLTLPGSGREYYYHKLPHKSGPQFNVGNPLAHDFLGKMNSGVLASQAGEVGQNTLQLNQMISFWRSARNRICNQFVVWLDHDERQGSIVPCLITAGTATRRAVEPTWLTASNAKENRVGSELKSLIEAPPGYHLVGADVDSQELWIASVIGDAHFAGMHGCTALGWMTLQGNKTDGTDLHSVTAKTIGISRDHAKIFNYGRIYGAGKKFAVLLLQQFNPSMSMSEAEGKADILYEATKGKRMYLAPYLPQKCQRQQLAAEKFAYTKSLASERVSKQFKYRLNAIGESFAETYGISVPGDKLVTYDVLKGLSIRAHSDMHRHVSESSKLFMKLASERMWVDGSESHTFNKLESIATSPRPTTPVLGCHIVKALELEHVGNKYMTSRVNWVVQSSAVDYLHLMLVCMKWLFSKFDIDGRFCISIHDEVRYLVKSEDRYRAAMALQIANLMTRAMFAYKLGINDLPLSTAFFSAVDIDHVLRKEVDMDSKTPSNPLGLEKGHKIPHGEALDIYEVLCRTNNGCLHRLAGQESEKRTVVT